MDRQKLQQVAKLAGMSEEDVEEVINYDWHNSDEHARWLETASAEEIADWVEAVA